MKFVALGSTVDTTFPGRTAEEVAALGRAEARRAWELYQSGILREIHFRTDRRASVQILEAPDEATARAALDSLPFVQEGIITFELVGLRPYDGWARLFRTDD